MPKLSAMPINNRPYVHCRFCLFCRLSHYLLDKKAAETFDLYPRSAGLLSLLRFPLLPRRLSHYLSDKKKAEKSVLEMAGKLTQQLQVRW